MKRLRTRRRSPRRRPPGTGTFARIRTPQGTRRLRRNATFRVGRRPDNDLVLREKAVSRHHATIAWDPRSAALVISDHGSSNGTQVDGRPVRSGEALHHGSVIQIGPHRLEVELSEECQLRQFLDEEPEHPVQTPPAGVEAPWIDEDTTPTVRLTTPPAPALPELGADAPEPGTRPGALAWGGLLLLIVPPLLLLLLLLLR